jgi:hypothetical protein
MTTATATHNIADYLRPGRRAHLVGIGGVSMRPLGLVLRSMGMEISGSDMNASVSTSELIEHGIPVFIGHSAENIRGADCIIRTAAVHNDNPEIAAARAEGIPIFERAQAWGYIMQSYRHAICVSGTHGKTTTTSMLTHIFLEAGRDPTVMIGGYLPLLKAGHRVGKGDTIILESCEYCNSFLNFFPTTAVVLDVDADHLDFFKDLEDVERSFRRFAELVPKDGLVIANGDDANTRKTLEGLVYTSFGFEKTNDVYGENFSRDWSELDVVLPRPALLPSEARRHRPSQRHERRGRRGRLLRLRHPGGHGRAGARRLPRRGQAARVQGHLSRRRRLRRLRPPPQRAARDARRRGQHGLQARDLRVPAAHLLPHQGALRRLRARAQDRRHRGADRHLRRARAEHDRHLVRRSGGRDPRQRLLPVPARGHGVSCPQSLRPGDILLTVGAGDIYKAGDAMFGK